MLSRELNQQTLFLQVVNLVSRLIQEPSDQMGLRGNKVTTGTNPFSTLT